MLICGIVAVLGLLSTYLFIPKYDAELLAEDDIYLLLEHPCLQPSMEELEILEDVRREKMLASGMYEMVEIIDYTMDDLENLQVRKRSLSAK